VLLLIGFALVAGAGTALSPCVLPILPAVLSAGVTGGRRRPLGVATGLALSFTFATVALVYVIDALGLPNDIARIVAIVVLLAFGVTLLIPPLSDRIEAWLSRFAGSPRATGGEGFGSGLLLGGGLGFVYAPCAGPILAGVITVSAAQDFTAGRLAVALAYGIGSAAVLYALCLGGRRVVDRLAPFRARIQIGLGVAMIAVAAVMASELDVRFQTAIADDLPAVLVNPTERIESAGAVDERLADVRGVGRGTAEEGGAEEAEQGVELPELGAAPEFTGTQEWLNTGGEPLSMEELRADGEVVLIDFWTYTCINCIRTLPYLRAWDERYGDRGLTIVGVHSPEFPFERDAGNVEAAIEDNDLGYPVVQDNDLATWNAWGNRYWPAKYLVDANGVVRFTHFGEGEYEATEQAIRTLLTEAGRDDLGEGARARGTETATDVRTPESYLGSLRAQGFVNGRIENGTHDYGGPGDEVIDALPPNTLSYQNTWRIRPDSATAVDDARLDIDFSAQRVFLVLGSKGGPRQLRVRLDGEPIADADAGEDVSGGVATIDEQRLYRLVDLPAAGQHVLTVEPEAGISGYAFTFG
jgi:cytochrome c biogenesis protein CcdA/thiol-disulfide isomerase/thioredoxin